MTASCGGEGPRGASISSARARAIRRTGSPISRRRSSARSFATPPRARWKKRAYDALFRRLFLDVFRLSRETVRAYAEAMSRFGARFLVAYARHLWHFAREMRAAGVEPPRLRAILLGVEKVFPEE